MTKLRGPWWINIGSYPFVASSDHMVFQNRKGSNAAQVVLKPVMEGWCRSRHGRPAQIQFGVGAPPILVYFSGDWDVHWGHGILTHGQFAVILSFSVCFGSSVSFDVQARHSAARPFSASCSTCMFALISATGLKAAKPLGPKHAQKQPLQGCLTASAVRRLKPRRDRCGATKTRAPIPQMATWQYDPSGHGILRRIFSRCYSYGAVKKQHHTGMKPLGSLGLDPFLFAALDPSFQ